MSDYLNAKTALRIGQFMGLENLSLPIDTIESMCDDLETSEQENAKLKEEVESHKQSLQELDYYKKGYKQLLDEIGIRRKVNMEQQEFIQKCQTEIETQAQTIAILSATIEKLEGEQPCFGALSNKLAMLDNDNRWLKSCIEHLERNNKELILAAITTKENN